MSRCRDFQAIADAVAQHIIAQSSCALVAEGDSLALLKLLPSHSVSLILTDPPYHSTKKDNITGDTSFRTDADYLAWIACYIREWARILRPNGSIFCFCSSKMAARIEMEFSGPFNVLSQIVWTKPNDPGFDGWKQKMRKESLRQWYAHSERIIFAEPAMDGDGSRSYFGNLIRERRQQVGLTMHQLTAMIGAHGKVNHGGAVSNWEAGRNIPSRTQYDLLIKALVESGGARLPPYEDSLFSYEDGIRPFNVDASMEFTDVWDFPSVRPYNGKHPAEKPGSLLKHAISATTFPGDIVLDCFSGSGSTAEAAGELDRYAVAFEIERRWSLYTASRLGIPVKEKS